MKSKFHSVELVRTKLVILRTGALALPARARARSARHNLPVYTIISSSTVWVPSYNILPSTKFSTAVCSR